MATEEKTNSGNQSNCSNYTAVYFGRPQNNPVTTAVQSAWLNWFSAVQSFIWTTKKKSELVWVNPLTVYLIFIACT